MIPELVLKSTYAPLQLACIYLLLLNVTVEMDVIEMVAVS